MAASLTWGGVLSTPWFHYVRRTPRQLLIADIAFPHTTGRTLMILGSAQSADSSEQYLFEEQDQKRNRIVAATQAEISTMVAAIVGKMNSSSPLGTLRYVLNSGYDSGNLTNYQLKEFTPGDWQRVVGGASDKIWHRPFRALFIKVH